MNHLEQVVSEWLQYRGYFVRTGLLVGPRASGGHEGELDVVAYDHATGHFVHIECSLDGDSWADRERRFAAKFARGRQYAPAAFPWLPADTALDQIALLHFAAPTSRTVGGARMVTVRAFVGEMLTDLRATSSATSAVPAKFALIRTLQLANEAHPATVNVERLLPMTPTRRSEL